MTEKLKQNEVEIAELTKKLHKLSEMSKLMEDIKIQFDQLREDTGGTVEETQALFDKLFLIKQKYDSEIG